MLKRISILILLVFFSCSSPALAAKHHKTTDSSYPRGENVVNGPTLRAETAATSYWGRQVHCPAGVRVQYTNGTGISFADAASDAGVLAWSIVDDPQCVIHLNEEVWARRNPTTVERSNYHWFCDVIVHEEGHFAGIPDGGPPDSIMNAVLEEGSPNFNDVPQCLGLEG